MISSRTEMLQLDRSEQAPLYRQIYARFRSAIEDGMLQPGERVSSARNLASELGVARGTVETAYALLVGEGYFVARGQAGTVVSLHLPRRAVTQRSGSSSNGAEVVAAPVRAIGQPLPFQLGIPALDAFPRKLWARLAARRLRATGIADMFYGDPAGYAPLRDAIAAYLRVSRGVACGPAQVVVTAGYRASLSLVARVLLPRGATAWIEDPGYPPTREVLRAAGLRVLPVPVDGEGIVVAHGSRRAAEAKLAVVTPSHQAPLGVSMSMARRVQLLDWASKAKAWIVEDDYDGEYRYAGHPLPALKSLDTHDRVLYAGSFSKVLYPGLALGYLVVPEGLATRFAEAAALGSNGCPQLTQAIVADFLREGHFARHLRKMRALYARRRMLLANELARVFGARVEIDLQRGGMHLIARFERMGSDVVLAERARKAGLNGQALSKRSSSSGAGAQGLLMGFTNIASAAEARRLVARLRTALG